MTCTHTLWTRLTRTAAPSSRAAFVLCVCEPSCHEGLPHCRTRADGCWGSQWHLPAPHRAPARPVPPDIIHKFIRDKYSKRFPELESLVPNALDYIRTVKVSTEEGPPATTLVESALFLDAPGLSWGVTQLWARDRMGTGNRDWGKPRP